MKWRETGGSTFPHGNESGMSFRDYFAAQALNGILANIEVERWEQLHEQPNDIYVKALAKLCYNIADAMVQEGLK